LRSICIKIQSCEGGAMNAMIDQAMACLEQLGEQLTEEVSDETIDQRLTARGKACKEAQLSIQVLTMKLQALHHAGPPVEARQLQLHGCEVCD